MLNNGTLGVSGSLDVATAVDPASAGIFQLTGNSSLEVAAATGTASKVQFQGSNELIADNFASFGSSGGGPLLESFGAGDSVDLRQLASSNLSLNFNPATGSLAVSNGTQTATLYFQTSSLGAGTFHAASDSGNGVLITHA